jgi:eukaryotic-like serine/threonine-protein kinase
MDKRKIGLMDKILLEYEFRGKIVELKSGIHGIVYIVEHETNTFPRYVAYKTVNPTSTILVPREKYLATFLHETKQWFSYGNCRWNLRPFYITNVNKAPFICMDFCKSNLRQYIDAYNLASENIIVQTLTIFLEILKGLKYARSHGLIAHQDLKPENILLTDNSQDNLIKPNVFSWEPRIADFGMANAWKELRLPYGSTPYMAPEQFLYHTDEDFTKVDEYALGVMLTEALTGLHPCGEKTHLVWTKWTDDDWQNWVFDGKRNIDLPNTVDKLRDLVTRCLKVYPVERPSIEGIYDTLFRILYEINQESSQIVNEILEYHDSSEQNSFSSEWFAKSAIEISKISIIALEEQIDLLKNRIKQFEEQQKLDSEKCISLLDSLDALAELLLERDTQGDKQIAESIALKIIMHCKNNVDLIKADTVYGKGSLFRDIGVLSDYLKKGINILKNISPQKVDQIIKDIIQSNSKCGSALLFSEAVNARVIKDNSGYDIKKVFTYLDRAISLNPHEATFWFTKPFSTNNGTMFGLFFKKMD